MSKASAKTKVKVSVTEKPVDKTVNKKKKSRFFETYISKVLKKFLIRTVLLPIPNNN